MTFFSDAVFAIAMTLLVIEVRVPEVHLRTDAALAQALVDQLPKYIGFVVSFMVVGRFWVGHHRTMGLLKGLNPRLVWINLLFLMAVAFMPFPTAVFSDYVELRVGVGLYAGWLMVLGIMNHWLIAGALRNPAVLRDDADPADVRMMRRSSWIPLIIGSLAFAVGMVRPLWALIVLTFGSPVIGWLVRREWRKVGA
ncbi:TMEM175 family protein [Sphingomonas sp. GB1N7]|uniref:TMEM175 family protein n=1 Tax=Parasphingomonas caseinilytica TaxID=3096158 RepID=UPI002FCAEE05